ncbi:hypothetical protein L1987_05126 [Smallanthus sonchifolius]|uniref:Uncharacterized protein n=1 Tax=Smallanthus sonchifolius TaxID=185202 RepID=A0ACB9JUH1_9ASTR|nr:hypothetical protein L1987_05126 [Smallanthus sonchifolius]
METKTATFTFFTLLFLYTVFAARPTVDPPLTNPTTAGSKILLPGDKVTLDEPEKTTKNDLTPRTNFSRFHPINRHFQVRPHRGAKTTISTHRAPCLKHSQYMIPHTEVSNKKEEVRVAAERTDNSRSKTFRGEVPEKWLKVKHHYSSRRQHNNNHNHNNRNHNHNHNHNNLRDKNEESVMKNKNMFDREKMKSLINRRQKQKRNDDKSGLMKNIRKFLKHTFD